MSSLKKLALRGAFWTVGGYGGIQALRFGSNIILTRLLVPEMFGLMAIVNTIRQGLYLFSDIGIAQSIVQNPRGDDPDFLNTAWTVNVFRGFALWLVCLGLAWPVSVFYDDRRLLFILPVVGVVTILDGMQSSKVYLLQRHLKLGLLTGIKILNRFFAIVVMIVWAYFSPTVWALVGGAIAGSILTLFVSHWVLPGPRNRLTWEPEALKDLVSFGRWILASSVLMFLAEQSDRLMLGRLSSLEFLGIYTIASTLAFLPRDVVRQLSFRVVFPAVSKMMEMPRKKLRRRILQKRWMVLAVMAVTLAAFVAGGDLLINWLYDDRYTAAQWMLPILSVGVWFSVLLYTSTPISLALGKPAFNTQANCASLIVICTGIPVGYAIAGNLGAVLAVASSDIFSSAVLAFNLHREGIDFTRQNLSYTALFFGLASAFVLLRYSLGFGLPIDTLWIT